MAVMAAPKKKRDKPNKAATIVPRVKPKDCLGPENLYPESLADVYREKFIRAEAPRVLQQLNPIPEGAEENENQSAEDRENRMIHQQLSNIQMVNQPFYADQVRQQQRSIILDLPPVPP